MARIKITLRFLLLVVFYASCCATFPQTVDAENLKWSRVNIPSNGVSGQWILAQGSDLHSLTLASDGTLYCSANPSLTPFRLFKSTDGGGRWSYTGRVEDVIIDIAVLNADSNCVYYATAEKVYKSIDAGASFTLLAANPGGSGLENKQITSLDVASWDNVTYVAVGVLDRDAAQYGGVYVFDESQPAVWRDCGIGNYDVYKVAFSPRFAEDGQLIAIVTDEQDTLVLSGNIEAGWPFQAGAARLPGLIPLSADIVFPADYDSAVVSGQYVQFISLNTGYGQGGIYSLRGQPAPAPSTLTPLHSGDFSSLAISGNSGAAKLLAGSAGTTQIYFSEDAGVTWSSSLKPPSGDASTEVLMAADIADSGVAYAITSGAESAFSVSRDQGNTWNQTGLIDTRISTILDLAVSPDYALDNTLFLLTADIQNSLWYTSDQGLSWERIYCTAPSQPERINLVLLSPQYPSNGTLFLAGTGGGNPFIWKSENSGQSFSRTASVDPATGVPVNIDAWTITSGNVLFVGNFDGDRSLVYQTGPNSLSYVDKGVAGRQIISSLALSPNYNNDHSILAGNTFGSVFFSNDSGLVFESLPLDAAEPTFAGNIAVAFDADFAQNKTIYAADDIAGKGVYRFVIGESFSWESIDTNLSAEAGIGQLAVSSTGVLYALNSQTVKNAGSKGGMERSLNSSAAAPVFQTVIGGLNDGITLKKLWAQGNNLWTIDTQDTHNKKLLIYTDTLVNPVILVSPADSAAGLNPDNTTLSWQPVGGATAYHWQIDTAGDFLSIADEGDTASSQITLTNLDKNTTYHWRAMAVLPVVSPWSTVRVFNTCHLDAPTLSQPASSGTISIKPVFKWSISAGAEQYGLQISLNPTFSTLAINRICDATVWQSDISLNYNSTYYWKVRAIAGVVNSGWSAVGVFITQAAPTPPAPSTPAPTPTPTRTPSPTLAPAPAPAPLFTSPSPQASSTPVQAASTTPPASIASQASSSAPDIKSDSSKNTAVSVETPLLSSAPPGTTPAGPVNSTSPVLFAVVGGLAVLTTVSTAALFMLKKVK